MNDMNDFDIVREELRAAHRQTLEEWGSKATPETEAQYPPLAALARIEAENERLRHIEEAAFWVIEEDLLSHGETWYTLREALEEER